LTVANRGRVAALGALLVPLLTAAATGAELPLTLDEAVARALEKNTTIRVEREGLDAAEAAVKGSRGIYDPLVTLESGWGRVSEPVNSSFSGAPAGEAAPTFGATQAALTVQQLLPTGGTVSLRANGARQTSDGTFTLLSPSYATRLGLELRQPLFRSRKVARSAIRVASFDRDRASASLRGEIANTVTNVERAYWHLTAARREVVVREEALTLAEEQLGETKIRVEQGVSAEAEVAQPRAELERRRGELLASREAVSRAENALKLLILDDSEADLWVAPVVPKDAAEIETVPADPAGLMDKALATRPEIDAAQAVLERRRVETELARERARPTVDAVASYDRHGLAGEPNPAAGSPPGGGPLIVPPNIDGGWGRSVGTLTDGDFSTARVGLVLQLPIGNRAAKANVAIAGSAERQAEIQLAQARQAVRAEVMDAAATLETARQRIAAARSAREAAEVQLSAERDRFAAGLSTNFLVLTRQNDLSRARLDEIASIHDYRTARTGVARATGTLLEERAIKVEEEGK
jgi:outer membrane protein